MATFRSLGLLASHREQARIVRQEIESRRGSARQTMPYTRAVVLESLRLWPTTPLLLRETTEETTWSNGMLPAGTGVVIYTPFFHRDSERLPYADRFAPELWNGAEGQQGWPLIPFSEGPAMCPGRHLVLLLAPAVISAILDNVRLKLKGHERLRTENALPATLNHYSLRFETRSR
jgi:cytochrome P450